MTCGSRKVRRLSTESSVTKPPHYILTTDWLWYWKDEYGLWLEYGKQVSMVMKHNFLHHCFRIVGPTGSYMGYKCGVAAVFL